MWYVCAYVYCVCMYRMYHVLLCVRACHNFLPLLQASMCEMYGCDALMRDFALCKNRYLLHGKEKQAREASHISTSTPNSHFDFFFIAKSAIVN